MRPAHTRKLQLVCVLCNEALADVEKACTGLTSRLNQDHDHDHDSESRRDSQTMETLSYDAESEVKELTRAKGVIQHYAGYHSMSPETESRNEVVATKCGHMFHQGCLRKHVHKSLIDGKGGSLFCPICTRPFQMNRLWHVVIPPTKAQRERFIQLKMMKEQNADMVKQLKTIRSRITEEESHLANLKKDAEQCLSDIQQKQKLLDSISGPTNREIAELTKIHMKRQEILHVVTQHNADLLKLLAEESNISTGAAEKIFASPQRNKDNNNNNITNHKVDVNLNYPPSSPESENRSGQPQQLHRERGDDGCSDFGVFTMPSVADTFAGPVSSGKSSKKARKTKSGRKKKKKKSEAAKEKKYLEYSEFPNFPMSIQGTSAKLNHSQMPNPSKIRSMERIRVQKEIPHGLTYRKPEFGTADTFTKWNIESLKHLMSLDSNMSEATRTHLVRHGLVPPPPPEFSHGRNERETEKIRTAGVSHNYHQQVFGADVMNSSRLLPSRKPPMMYDTEETNSDRQGH